MLCASLALHCLSATSECMEASQTQTKRTKQNKTKKKKGRKRNEWLQTVKDSEMEKRLTKRKIKENRHHVKNWFPFRVLTKIWGPTMSTPHQRPFSPCPKWWAHICRLSNTLFLCQKYQIYTEVTNCYNVGRGYGQSTNLWDALTIHDCVCLSNRKELIRRAPNKRKIQCYSYFNSLIIQGISLIQNNYTRI